MQVYRPKGDDAIAPAVAGVPLPLGFNAMCEGGTNFGEPDGTIVPCTEAPQLYSGRPTPSWMGAAPGRPCT